MTEPIVMERDAVALMRRTFYAASEDNYRPVLRCAHFDGDAVVCTDSYRMAVAYFDGPEVSGLSLEAAGLKSLTLRGYPWTPDPDEVLSSTKKYPNWRSLIDCDPWVCDVTVPRVATLAYLKGARSRLGRTRSDEALYVDVDTATGILVAHKTTYDGNREQEAPPLTPGATTGSPVGLVRFNLAFFVDLLKNCAIETVALDISSPVAPMKVREPGITHLLMPVRVR